MSAIRRVLRLVQLALIHAERKQLQIAVDEWDRYMNLVPAMITEYNRRIVELDAEERDLKRLS